MNDYEALLKMHENDDLDEIRARVDEKDRIMRIIGNIKKRIKELESDLEKASRALALEQYDVEQLRKMTMANFLLNVTGKMQERLDKEISEADAAAAKYKAIQEKIAFLNEEIEKHKKQADALGNCKTEYKLAYEARKKKILADGGQKAEALLILKDRLDYLNSQLKETKEAISAGKNAFIATDKAYKALSKLNNADTIGAGVGIIALSATSFGAVAGATLGEAMVSSTSHNYAEDMMRKIEIFTTELEDVKLRNELVSGNDFLPLMFVQESAEHANRALYVIDKANRMLKLHEESLEEQIKEIEAGIDEVIL